MAKEAMTVEEMRDALAGYDEKMPIFLATRAGTDTILEPVTDLSPQKMAYHNGLEINAVSIKGEAVIALQVE